MNKKIVFANVLALASLCAFAQEENSVKSLEEVVISDSKFPLAKEKSGKVIVKITAEDLKKNAGQSVASILSTIAGVEINGNHSVAGKNQEYYIRGGRSRQTLIMIDGIPVTDASGISLQYDLRLISVDQVESIEIMKGASSTLYGSGAATGVINIQLKKSSTKAIAGNAFFNVGSQDTATKENNYAPNDYMQGFSVNGTLNKVKYVASLNHNNTTGMSEAKGDNFEPDGADKLNALVRFGVAASKKMDLDFFTNYDRLQNDFDGSYDGVNSADRSQNTASTEQFRFGFSPKVKYNKGEFVIHTAFNTVERGYSILDTYSNTVNDSKYKSRSATADAFNKYTISERLFVVVGGQFQFHEMNSKSKYESIPNTTAKFSTIDPYATIVYNSKLGFNINTGARYNMHNVYGNHLVYNFNPSYVFKKVPLKLLASYSTAYITPSLYQLYSPYGNLDLTPEENSTLEAGFETDLGSKKLLINAVAFQREETNTFEFFTDTTTWESKYINIDGTNVAKGVESMISYVFNAAWKISGNYTFTQTEEKLNRLLPKHKANVSLDVKATSKTLVTLAYQFVDKRKDAFYDAANFVVAPVQLKAYKLVNLNVRQELLKDKLQFFASATNLFNEDFVEVFGYNTKGRNFKIGLNFIF